ncbi:hypothetical protein TNCV_3357651 [Trichonephila clavipes]|nr:hypothetical protein TNCV_3357651 [Trichonephila clavipes]
MAYIGIQPINNDLYIPQPLESVSTRAIRSRLHEVKLRVPATGALLTAQHRDRRLAWWDRHRTRTIKQRKVLFTDESRNSLTGFPWPTKSLCLCFNEHLWYIIGRDMNRRPQPQSVDDLHIEVDVDNTRLILVHLHLGAHYRLFSVWTLVPVRLYKQQSGHTTVYEIASEAADRLTWSHQ